MDNLWVVMVSKQIADAIRKDLDGGRFTDATNSTNLLKAFQENISKLCQSNGGHTHVFLPEWIVMECPQSVAEQIPQLLSSFNSQIGHSMACGVGLDFEEAIKAVHDSERTGHITLYKEKNTIIKNEDLRLPPNLFDYGDQDVANNDGTHAEEQEFVEGPDFKTSLQLAQVQLQAIIQQLGGNAQADAQKQMEQQAQAAQQQQQAQQQPRDLTEALHGQQIQGRNPYSGESEKKPEEKKEAKKDDTDTEKDELDESEDDGDHVQQKLGAALLHIKQQIPQLMDLAEKNPEAFKQSMSLVQKLLSLTKKTKGNVEKSDVEILTEELNKKIIHFPVGTIKDRKKKVLVNGKARWRSIISGEVKDLQGQPISVKSSNLASQKGKQAGEK